MKKVIVSLVALGLLAVGASASQYTYNDYRYSNNTTTNVDITKVDADLSKSRAASDAMASVELNPDHEGWSVGVGMASFAGEVSTGVGVMYSVKATETTTVGINVKGYNGEGGYKGGSVGLTVGF